MMPLKATLSLLLLSSLAISISAHDGYKCDHDSIKQNPGILYVHEDMSSLGRGRNLQQADSSSFYYSTIDNSPIDNSTVDSSTVDSSTVDNSTVDNSATDNSTPSTTTTTTTTPTTTATPTTTTTTTTTPTTTTTGYPNIRIQTYTAFLDEDASSSFASYMENQILPPIVDYFQAALHIKYPIVGNLTLASNINQICERSTPDILYQGVAADFFIYYDILSNSGSQIANTMFCYLASGTGRPLIARTVVNPSQVPLPNGDVLIHEKNMLVILHEMIHGLGFSSSSFPYFIDSNANQLSGQVTTTSIGGTTYGVLNVPVLTNKLQNYFGCSSVPGAILENSGGSATASSHFERQFFLYELMTSGSILGLRTSEFSLTVLEASGWYAPDYSYAEPFSFGQGLGCSFLSYTCTGSSTWDNEFCTGTNSERGCSPTGRGGGYCNSDPLLGNCKYMYAFENNDCQFDGGSSYANLPGVEVYGRDAGSKCFTGDLSTNSYSSQATSFCFTYTCNNNGLATTLDVQLGSTSVTCTQAGQMTVDGYYGSIDCPDPMTFCSTVGVQYCPRNCMGRGTCVNNTCQCDSGYSGIDCALGPLGA